MEESKKTHTVKYRMNMEQKYDVNVIFLNLIPLYDPWHVISNNVAFWQV